jgi:type II secretory pathway pseudopilin PulG
MLGNAFHNLVKHKAVAFILLVCLLLTIAVPQVRKIRRRFSEDQAIQNLNLIQSAKERFAKTHHSDPNSAILDSHDLVPNYLPIWPTSPPDHAAYSANSVSFEPTVNGLTASEIRTYCDANDYRCIF